MKKNRIIVIILTLLLLIYGSYSIFKLNKEINQLNISNTRLTEEKEILISEKKEILKKKEILSEEKGNLIQEKEILIEEKEILKKEILNLKKGNLNQPNRSMKSRKKEFSSTAYCPCEICNGKWAGQPTATGTQMVQGRTIAVDPDVIPLGTEVYIEGKGNFIAEDTGSAIKGNIIDIFFDSHQKALEYGRQKVILYY